MEKNWFKSKTFWAAVLGMCGTISAYMLGTIDAAGAITQLGVFLGMFGLRDAL